MTTPLLSRRFACPIRRAAGALLGLALLTSPRAHAQTVYGLGTLTMDFLGNLAGSQGIITIDPTNGVAVGGTVPVVGVATNQNLVGMDFRPSNGQLYTLGYDSVTAAPAPNAQLYTLNPTSGAVTAVGSAVRLELGRRTTRIGFDFNPVADLIRVVSTNRANYRLNPTTGALAGTDTNLAYAGGAPAVPGIGAVAYSNSFPGATSTTLYAFDELNTTPPANPANTALLSIVNPPNAGTLTAPVPVMFGTSVTGSPAAIDIDIYANGTTNRNDAFLTEVTATGSSNFYRLNLTTGVATLMGNTVPRAIPFAIRDIAVSIGTVLATAPAALAQLAGVYPNPAHGTATLLLPAALRGTRPTTVTVTDNLGRVVLRCTLAPGVENSLELPLATLLPGVYAVLARTAVGLVAKRLVVQ
ncbi:DUF4394 domain-containing protein [Hymenobacter terricola]|uniref:DUF4394 domain-containing protein n=1 Tax=Hymenobacter terricola TaxID=2819236 RepID=UPI001B301AFF|nr:DUF4394 domain-containing protein [Hymenobacter terricola]